MDAWEIWCKDSVLCFGECIEGMMKVYFADPRNLSVYHVIDFDYMKFGLSLDWGPVRCCILLRSKIYILLARVNGRGGDSIDIYFCDVSTPTELRNGNYEWCWQQGPSPNCCEVCPSVFSLMGNIYVFSIDIDERGHFEVLKSDSSHWEVLPPPCLPLLVNRMFSIGSAIGSFKISGKMIIMSHGNSVVMYDAERNEWTTKELYTEDPFAQVPKIDRVGKFTMDCLHVGVNGLFEINEPEDRPCPQWHLFQIRDRKFCFIALFGLYFEFNKSCAQVGTFDLVQCSSESDEQDSKHLKLGNSCYRITYFKSR